MTNENRNTAFAVGLVAGVAGVIVGGLLAGIGRPVAGDQFVTSSADGRNAYLWAAEGNSLRFVASGEATKGKGGDHQDGADKGKPADDDKDKGDHGKPNTDDKGKGKNKK